MMRLVIALLLLVLAAGAAAEGRWVNAAANVAFAAVAGMLAWSTLPDRPRPPRAYLLAALAAGVVLWSASLLVRGL